MVAYIILTVTLVALAVPVVLYLAWGRQWDLPEGTYETESKHGKFVAKVIFRTHSTLDRFSQVSTARRAALSMRALENIIKRHGIKNLKVPKNCAFVVLTDKEYVAETAGLGVTAGYAWRISSKMTLIIKKWMYKVTTCDKYIPEVLRDGGVFTHELIHVASHNATGKWDMKHNIVHGIVGDTGKGLDALVKEEVKWLLLALEK